MAAKNVKFKFNDWNTKLLLDKYNNKSVAKKIVFAVRNEKFKMQFWKFLHQGMCSWLNESWSNESAWNDVKKEVHWITSWLDRQWESKYRMLKIGNRLILKV